MAASKEQGDPSPSHSSHGEALEPDVAFAGYDPYIVAITGGSSAEVSKQATSGAEQSTESRKVKLMAWLRAHGA
jgi:hypothetical protein